VRVLAEGVEQTSQQVLLRQMGGEEARGYLLSPPCPVEQIPDLSAEQLYSEVMDVMLRSGRVSWQATCLRPCIGQ